MTDAIHRDQNTFRLALEDGEVIEVDGSTLTDRDTGRQVPAVVVRMPAWRAHSLSHVPEEWTFIADLFDSTGRAVLSESTLTWALHAACGAAGGAEAARELPGQPSTVTSSQRVGAAAVLRDRIGLSTEGLIAVVDAAAWWVGQPGGHGYATSLFRRGVPGRRLGGRRVHGPDPAACGSITDRQVSPCHVSPVSRSPVSRSPGGDEFLH